jgi:hypothetical protein
MKHAPTSSSAAAAVGASGLLVLLLTMGVAVVRADIAPFGDSLQSFHIHVIRSLEMYGTDDPPSTGYSGDNGKAYIRLEGTSAARHG